MSEKKTPIVGCSALRAALEAVPPSRHEVMRHQVRAAATGDANVSPVTEEDR